MTSRTLSVAAVAVLAIGLDAMPAGAQNLDAGKSAPQIFASTCAACHRTPRGLIKSVAPQALPGFLRQHYTTGTDMARQLSGYLLASGGVAAEPRQARSRDDEPRRPAAARTEQPRADSRPQPAEPPLRAWRLPWEKESPAEAAAKSEAARTEQRPRRAGTAKRRAPRAEERQHSAEPTIAAPASHAPARAGHKDKPPVENGGVAAKDEAKDVKDAAVAPTGTPDKPAVTEAPAVAAPQEAGKAEEAAKPGYDKSSHDTSSHDTSSDNKPDDRKPAASEAKPVAAEADKPAPPRPDPVPQVTPAPDTSASSAPTAGGDKPAATEGDKAPAADAAAKPVDAAPPADTTTVPTASAPAEPKASSESR